jgi:hypothetical protein
MKAPLRRPQDTPTNRTGPNESARGRSNIFQKTTMQIKITEDQKTEITALLDALRPEIDQLRATDERLTDLARRSAQNHSTLTDLEATELPNDKELLGRIACRERVVLLSALTEKSEQAAFEQRGTVGRFANDAVQLFHSVASKSLFDHAEAELKNSLPDSVLADQALTFRLLSESATKRQVGRFLNPRSINPREDDNKSVIAEATRLVDLLAACATGRDVAVPGSEVEAVA